MSLYKYGQTVESDFLVDKVLRQGQRLRNAIVESILNNDPFSVNTMSSQTNIERNSTTDRSGKASREQLEAYLNGENVFSEGEQEVIRIVKNMSAADLCKATERSYETYRACNCNICTAYQNQDLSCDLRRSRNVTKSIRHTKENLPNDITEVIRETYRSQAANYLKHVDSMQIAIHNLTLNDVGTRKIMANETETKIKFPISINHTYFIEYRIPDMITGKPHQKPLPGVDHNLVRICSKKFHQDAVYFKTHSLHEVANLEKFTLQDIDVLFKVSYRTLKQKQASTLGVAKFNLGMLELSKYMSCSQRLAVFLSDESPIVVGHLKVIVKLGCGKMYFGKEFLDAISASKDNTVLIETSSESTNSAEVLIGKKATPKSSPVKETAKIVSPIIKETVDKAVSVSLSNYKRTGTNTTALPPKKSPLKSCSTQPEITDNDKQVLFGFLYVSEAEYADKDIDSYFTCRPFCLDETARSRLIPNSANPLFDFSQKIPLLYEDDLLNRFRENYMILEFWEKTDETDVVFGLCKINLNQLYIAYRNPIIVKYLLKNKQPVVNTDWWEPITTETGSEIVGRVQILLALGSEEQIKNLESERGFKQESVYSKPKTLPAKARKAVLKEPEKVVKKAVKIDGHKVNAAVQSDVEMDESSGAKAQEKMENFLSQLLAQRSKNIYVENATNTETITQNVCDGKILEHSKDAAEATNMQLRKTSDLLDSLQKALSSKEPPTLVSVSPKVKEYFKAHVIIENALHLRTRKNCKPRKSKNKKNQHEAYLPNTYVTFETLPGVDATMTPVAHKSTNPKWDFSCDVNLPVELLTDNRKRLIFKVWNRQSDTEERSYLETDVVLGFAALDLTVLTAGLPSVQGWFNIVDFSSKCNGQVKISVAPLEHIPKFSDLREEFATERNTCSKPNTDPVKLDEPSELLSRALKRKFIELDEITQRLRLRLSDVTKDESDTSNDELADEFERDINTLCVEDDFDMINLQIETTNFNSRPEIGIGLLQAQVDQPKIVEEENIRSEDDPVASVANPTLSQLSIATENSLTNLDKQLIQGKQHIDSLLEKLSLISASESDQGFSNRYVSGCSVNQETEAADILKELGIESRPQINAESLFNAEMFQRIYSDVELQGSSEGASSSSSSMMHFAEYRRAPDGAGTSSEDKVKAVP